MAKIVKAGGVGKNPNLEKLTRVPPAVFSPRVVSEMKSEAFVQDAVDYYMPCNLSFDDVLSAGVEKVKPLMETSSQSFFTTNQKSEEQLELWKPVMKHIENTKSVKRNEDEF